MMTLSTEQHGFTCVMSGQISENDMREYLAQARKMLPAAGRFNLLVDQRESHVMTDGAQQAMAEVMQFFNSRGLQRVAVVCSSAVVAMQMNRLAAGSPVKDKQVAVDGKAPNWREDALKWLESGVRPG